MNLGALVVKLLLESAQYKGGLKDAANETTQAAGKLQQGLNEVTQATSDALAGQSELTDKALQMAAAFGTAASLAVAAGATVAKAYQEAQEEQKGYLATLTMSNHAIDVSVGKMADMARGVDAVVGTQKQAAGVVTALVASAQVGSQHIQNFAITAISAERDLGQSTSETVKNFASLGEAPLKASLRLNEGLNYLTAATVQQIKAAEDLGQKEHAASIAQTAYAEAMKTRAAEMERHLGSMQKAWRWVRDAAAEAWDAMLGVGRPDTLSMQIAAQEKAIATLEAQKAKRPGGWATGDLDARIEAGRQHLQVLKESARLEERAAAGQAAYVAQQKAATKWAQDADQYLDAKVKKEEALRNKIAQIRAEGRAANAKEEEIEKRVAIEREKAAEKKATPKVKADYREAQEELRVYSKGLDDFNRIAASATAQTEELSRTQVALREIQASPAWAQFNRQQQEQIIVAAAVAQESEDAAAAHKRQAKEAAEAAKAYESLYDSVAKTADSLEEQVKRQREANETVGFSAAALADLEVARTEEMASMLERRALLMDEIDTSKTLGDELRRQAKLYRELAAAKQAGAGKQAAFDSAREVEQTWEKAAFNIGDSLNESLMRAFESGKDMGKAALDYLVAAAKTTVMRPVMSVMLSPLNALMGGAMGSNPATTSALAGMAGQAGGGLLGSLASGLGSVTSVLGQFGTAALATTQSMLGMTGTAAQLAHAANGIAASSGLGGASGLAQQLGSAVPYAAVAAAVLAALGAFRTTKQVGAGLSGTLGQGDITDYALMRKSGYLLGGPDYSLQNRGVAEQSDEIQTAYEAMRTATAGMAKQLGLSADEIEKFTVRLGSDLIHPDTGGYGIKLDGLSAEQAQAKVTEALATANDQLAQQILGTWTTTTKTVTSTVIDAAGHWDSGIEEVSRQIVSTVEETSYQASEFAKKGETASQTLARLAGDITVVNAAFDTLGATLLKGLKGADQASSLVAAFGGQDAFQSATGAYFEAFYSEEEKRATVTRQITEALSAQNLAMPTTIAGYRALVEAQDLTTASGQKAAAVLVTLGPKFAELWADIEDAADKTASQVSQYLGPVNDAATQSNETLIKLLDERKSLEADLASAMGNTADAAALATANMDAQGKEAWEINQRLKQQLAGQEAINGLRDSNKTAYRDLVALRDGEAAAAALDLAEATKDMTNDQRMAYVQQAALAAGIQQATKAEEQKQALQEELLSLTETSAEALTRQRNALEESVRAQFDAVQAAKAAKAAAEERKSLDEEWLRVTGQTVALRAVELDKLDPGNRLLQQRIWNYEDLQTAEEDAWKAVERAASAERERLEAARDAQAKVVDQLTDVFDVLKDQVRELWGEVDSTRQMLAAQGQGVIDEALRTGQLPKSKDLADAIAAARSGLNVNQFASRAEYDYAQLVLASKLDKLKDGAGDQLTVAEQQLKAAEQQLDALDAQLEALKNVGSTVQTLSQAVQAYMAAKQATSAVTGGSGSGRAPSSGTATAWQGNDGAIWNESWVRAPGDGTLYRPEEFRALVNTAVTTPEGAMNVYQGLQASGMSSAAFEANMGWSSGTVEAWARANGLPVLDSGTNYMPEDTLAFLHKGEAVIPQAFNPDSLPYFAHAGAMGLSLNLGHLVAANDGRRSEDLTHVIALLSSANDNLKPLATVSDLMTRLWNLFDGISPGKSWLRVKAA